MARRASRLRFNFLGWKDGWYVLRVSTRSQPPLAVQAFQTEVLEWLIEQAIIPNELSYLSNGNTGDGPPVPAASDGSALCLLLRRAPDVLRLDRQFGCRGITPEVMFEALQAEASVHRFVVRDIVLIAYDAVSRFAQVQGADLVNWDDLSDDEREFFIQRVQEYAVHGDWPAHRLHESWLDLRRQEGWTYAPDAALDEKHHPWMVPFAKLPAQDQASVRLTASVTQSLLPLLR